MKAKKIYQICLVLCGLFISLAGIACLVVATLLTHDSDLKMSHEAKSRTYGTQYWLGLPLIAFGGLLMLVSPSLQKRKRMVAFNLFVCIPLLTCCLVAAVLHGAAYTHFLSIHQNRLYLEDHDFLCSDITRDGRTCECAKPNRFLVSEPARDPVQFSVPCTQQKSLVGFHGALLTFAALAFALLLGILVISVIFLVHFFKLQLAMSTTTAGQDNAGFSHAGGRRHSLGTHVDPPSSQHSSLTTLHVPQDLPPSYESLLTSLTSRAVTNDVTDARARTAVVNRQARVRYTGQSSSRFNHQIPGLPEPNEVLSSDENENSEIQIAINEVDNTTSQNSEVTVPLRQRNDRHGTDQLNDASRPSAENRPMISTNVVISTSLATEEIRQENEQTQNREAIFRTRPGQGIRNHPSNEHSNEIISHERSNSRLTAQRSSETTVSSDSEDGVYIDITQNPGHASNSLPNDPSHTAVTYRGQLDSNSMNDIQTRSIITHEQEDAADEGVVEERATQNTTSLIDDSSNATNTPGSTEQDIHSLNSTEPASTGTENLTEPNAITQSTQPESNDLNSLNPDSATARQTQEDVNAESSFEILSI